MLISYKEFSIRDWLLSDIKSLVMQASNPIIPRYMRNTFPSPYTELDALKWVDENINSKVKSHFAVCKNDNVIGGIGIVLQDDIMCKNADLGYWINPDYWGQGIMSILIGLFCDYVWQNFDIVRIEAFVFSENKSSAKVLVKNGFILESVMKKKYFKNSNYSDALCYVLYKNI